jgi:hypothetical protein
MTSSHAVGNHADEVQPLLEALKTIAASLKADGVPFALAGSYAVYARGGARSLHDVDFVVLQHSVAAVTSSLESRGLKVIQPPEDWLIKAYHDGVCIDVIHTLAAGPVDQAMLDRADEMPVESVRMPVLSATDLLIGKLRALSEHACNLEPVLAVARTLREQLDQPTVLDATRGHPYAEAAMFLIWRLGILPEVTDTKAGAQRAHR